MTKFSHVTADICLVMLLVLCLSGNSRAAEHPDNLYRQGRYKEAMAGYEKLDLDNPKEISYRFNRGCAAYQLKDYQSALAAFTSVYTRAGDNEMRFKAAYNLGNTGFEAGDYRAATDYYKEAIRLNPQSKEARQNLELALHKLEEAKKQEQNKEQEKKDQPNQGQQCKRPQGKEAGQDQQKKDGQEKQDKQGEQQQQQKADQKGDKGDQQQDQADRKSKDDPKDLSGELTAASTAGQLAKKSEEQKEGQQARSVERNKAEALLNNIQEDRSHYLRLQVPEDKQGGGKSGKYW
ncbi:MAG: hypothetical protein A2511_06440 [Deltaproteobacteria bacterium RIFOXYD12_FULL_50_9]|nr:MAG: hypothetical protein A2511_06440 [Deltaproteobacteria bacterium RIFOXYD12_FULL_50_9]